LEVDKIGFSSKDATVVPAMAVASALGHMVVGPLVSRSLHIPGPSIAGIVIIAPFLVAGALTLRRGMILLTSTLNGVILSVFVPIGVLAIPIYFVVGTMLEVFCFRPFSVAFKRLRLFLAGGVANAISVLLIATIGLGTRNLGVLSLACTLGLISGALGGLIAATVINRVKLVFPRTNSGNLR
jgi:hypothetical protein